MTHVRLSLLYGLALNLFAVAAFATQDCETLLSKETYRSDAQIHIPKLAEGCDMASRNERGWTPLHFAAAYSDDPGLVRKFLQLGGDVEATTLDDPETEGVRELMKPIHVAASFARSPGVISVLVNRGAEIDARLPGDNCWFGRCTRAPIHMAAPRVDAVDVLEAFVAAGADLDLRDEQGNGPLHLAAMHSNHDAVELLLNAGASADEERFDGATALHQATLNPLLRLETLQLLLDAGVNPDERTGDGATALIYAAQKNKDLEIVRNLVEMTDLRCHVDEQGRSALREWERNAQLPQNETYWALHEECTE